MYLSAEEKRELTQALSAINQRLTKHRQLIYSILRNKKDHPTVDDIYARAKAILPSISIATVYNCLQTLVACKVIRQVNFDRLPSRFCPNEVPHAHFHCQTTGKVIDIPIPTQLFNELINHLPKEFHLHDIDILLHGSIKAYPINN